MAVTYDSDEKAAISAAISMSVSRTIQMTKVIIRPMARKVS